jgi:hypothetical protein
MSACSNFFNWYFFIQYKVNNHRNLAMKSYKRLLPMVQFNILSLLQDLIEDFRTGLRTGVKIFIFRNLLIDNRIFNWLELTEYFLIAICRERANFLIVHRLPA